MRGSGLQTIYTERKERREEDNPPEAPWLLRSSNVPCRNSAKLPRLFGIEDLTNEVAVGIVVCRCILDGEMLVWDRTMNRFADFGSNQEIAKAAKEGLDSDRQLCYVAFDILYDGDTSVIHQSLKERHELLRKVVKPIRGRLEILVPNGGLNTHRSSGIPCCSLIAYSVDDIERFFKETIENRDEGIVLKNLDSTWEPSDRSGKWLKLKPEYVRAGSDLDVLIIGGYYGSGRRGGEVGQFLVGLAERAAPNTYPRRFISFCRVGTGLSDEELDAIVTKLKPYFRSIILSITSDIRMIRSEVFAAPYSLRFPRIDRVRYDKPWHDCLDVECRWITRIICFSSLLSILIPFKLLLRTSVVSLYLNKFTVYARSVIFLPFAAFVELVCSSNGTTQWGAVNQKLQDDKPKRLKSVKKGDKKNASLVPFHFVQTDISHVKGESLIFSGMMVWIKFQAAKLHGDIIHYSWLFDSCSQNKLLPLHPKYFLFLSETSKKKLQEEMDEFSDSYYLDLDITELKQLLSNIHRSEDPKIVNYYRKKYCPKDKWCRFQGCCIYFHLAVQILNSDWKALFELALRRMKLEVSFGGGKISDNLSQATHLVVLSLPGVNADFDVISRSYSAAEVHLLHNKRMYVVRFEWLEDCIEKDQRLDEAIYNLKPSALEDSTIHGLKHDVDDGNDTSLVNVEKKNAMTSVCKDGKHGKRKSTSVDHGIKAKGEKQRAGTSTRTNKGNTRVIQPRTTRPRRGSKSAKISASEFDENASTDETILKKESESVEGNHGSLGSVDHESPDIPEESVGDYASSHRGRAVEREVSEQSKRENWLDSAHGTGNGAQESEKLEVTVDPVQAMLLDMIPSLGSKKAEGSDPVPESEKPSLDPNPVPAKKKKVSYKDVADELLRDL
ncbi:hypothetical protein RJ639_044639 [Escallonia herrerae]|uniref:DNA ligase IV n=1 Tax=Escallonia herrerae TaxID=1293975 RepID=A0AA88WCG2_9ASTE|nr:hypothetical protein RJ639_044639 [Escallonia herrerae]